MFSIILRRQPPYRNRPNLFDLKVAHSFGTHLISNPTNLRSVSHSRCTSSMSDPIGLNWISYDCSSMSAVPLPKDSPAPRILNPHNYLPRRFSWRPSRCSPGSGSLDPGRLLRIISWNIDFMAPDRRKRALSAMTHLKDVFGDPPPPSVIMLQEVHSDSLAAILEHSWIKKNFAISNVDAPERYFTIILVSHHLQAESWFRFPLPTRMRRDALLVDIPISPIGGDSGHSKRILRLCTAHLESLWESEGHEFRPRQLAQISALLKAPSRQGVQIAGGLLGGDMNPISPLDFTCHKTSDIDLRDVWEDTPSLPAPRLKPFQKDLTYGRAKGNTWGYQSAGAHGRKRMDKFLYTGSIDTEALSEAQDLSGKIGRLGIGLKTNVEVLACDRTRLRGVRGMLVEETYQHYYDVQETHLYSKMVNDSCVRKTIDGWVSDHFGIVVGVRVR